MANNKKVVSLNVVGTIVDWALLDQGCITTLEVKNYLRMKGFNATQENVSKLVSAYVTDFIDEECEYDIDGKGYTIAQKITGTPGKIHQLYSLKVIGSDEPKVAVNKDNSIVGTRTRATVRPTPVQAPATPVQSNRDYIAARMGTDSNTLARQLGISPASVRAYKAHVNR